MLTFVCVGEKEVGVLDAAPPETILPMFYSPVDLASSVSLSCSDTLWRRSVALYVFQGGCSCPKANFYSLLTISGDMLRR